MFNSLKKVYRYLFDVDIGSSLNYNPALDGIRGISILLVLFFHYFPGRFPFGFIGVDVFFLVSGYIITTVIVSKLKKSKFRFKEFYRNRSRRLFPALGVLLLSALIVGYLFFPSYYYKSLGKHVFSSALYWENFRLMFEVGYWDIAAHFKPLIHLWSLAIEEQFYLLWPLTLYILYKSGALKPKSLVLLTIFLFSLSVVFAYINPSKAFYNILARWWELSLGGTIALLLYGKNLSKGNKDEILAFLVTVVLLVYSILFLSINYFSPIRLLGVLLIASFLIFFASKYPRNYVLANPFLVAFGKISYSLYIWHYFLLSAGFITPLILFVSKEGIWYARGIKLLLMGLSIGISILSFRFLELPLRKKKSYKLAILYAVILAFIGMLGLIVYYNNGFPNRPFALCKLKYNIKNLKETEPPKTIDISCKILVRKLVDKPYFPKDFYCHADTKNPVKVNTLVVGDSHALAAYKGIFSMKPGDNLLLAISGWPASFMPNGDNIREARDREKIIKEIFEIISKLKHIKSVFVITRQNCYYYDHPDVDGAKASPFEVCLKNPNKPCDTKRIFKDQLKKLFKFFESKNLRVYYVLENPVLPFTSEQCMYKCSFIKTHECKIPYKDFLKREKEVRKVIKQVASHFKNVIVINPNKALCDNKYCYVVKDNLVLYRDDDHITASASYMLAHEIQKIIKNIKKTTPTPSPSISPLLPAR